MYALNTSYVVKKSKRIVNKREMKIMIQPKTSFNLLRIIKQRKNLTDNNFPNQLEILEMLIKMILDLKNKISV